MSNRDEFPDSVKRVLAERAAYLCSYDGCRELTVLPHTDPNRSLKTGRAAHIAAAAKGGPRFDEKQSNEERKSITNAIHLCSRHADIVDKDECPHSAETLRSWKQAHEAWVAQNDIVPTPPIIQVSTADGLLMGLGATRLTGEMATLYRDHVVRIEASSRHELLEVEMRAQFPEAVFSPHLLSSPAGTHVTIERERQDWHFAGSPGSSVELVGSPSPTPIFVMRIDVLRADRPIEFALRCVPDDQPSLEIFGPDAVPYFVQGKFLYRHREQTFNRLFCSAFDIDKYRRVSCRPITKTVQLIMQSRAW